MLPKVASITSNAKELKDYFAYFNEMKKVTKVYLNAWKNEKEPKGMQDYEFEKIANLPYIIKMRNVIFSDINWLDRSSFKWHSSDHIESVIQHITDRTIEMLEAINVMLDKTNENIIDVLNHHPERKFGWTHICERTAELMPRFYLDPEILFKNAKSKIEHKKNSCFARMFDKTKIQVGKLCHHEHNIPSNRTSIML